MVWPTEPQFEGRWELAWDSVHFGLTYQNRRSGLTQRWLGAYLYQLNHYFLQLWSSGCYNIELTLSFLPSWSNSNSAYFISRTWLKPVFYLILALRLLLSLGRTWSLSCNTHIHIYYLSIIIITMACRAIPMIAFP